MNFDFDSTKPEESQTQNKIEEKSETTVNEEIDFFSENINIPENEQLSDTEKSKQNFDNDLI